MRGGKKREDLNHYQQSIWLEKSQCLAFIMCKIPLVLKARCIKLK